MWGGWGKWRRVAEEEWISAPPEQHSLSFAGNAPQCKTALLFVATSGWYGPFLHLSMPFPWGDWTRWKVSLGFVSMCMFRVWGSQFFDSRCHCSNMSVTCIEQWKRKTLILRSKNQLPVHCKTCIFKYSAMLLSKLLSHCMLIDYLGNLGLSLWCCLQTVLVFSFGDVFICCFSFHHVVFQMTTSTFLRGSLLLMEVSLRMLFMPHTLGHHTQGTLPEIILFITEF